MLNNKENRIKCRIDSNHIDENGHLNNAYYSLYFDQARISLQRSFNLSSEKLREEDLGYYMSRYYVEIGKEVLLDSEIEIVSNYYRYPKVPEIFEKEGGRSKIYMHHEMFCNSVKVAECIQETFFVKLKENRKVPIKPLRRLIDIIKE